jgi:hypothetical protein
MMKYFLKICSFCLLVLCCGTYGQVYQIDKPGFDGFYIWAPRKAATPALEVDLYRRMLTYPGGSEQLLVNEFFTRAAAAGIHTIYWKLSNDYGKLLYPSHEDSAVQKWSNWGIDFSAFDYPAEAVRMAELFEIELYLLADENCLSEASQLYCNADIVTAIPESVTVIREIDFSMEAVAATGIDQRAWYFRRDFTVERPLLEGVPAQIAITAIERFELYVDGVYIAGNGSFESPEYYTVDLAPGEHSIAVKVLPPAVNDGALVSNCASLIFNMYWFDKEMSNSIVTDSSWKCIQVGPAGWYGKVFDSSSWDNASIVGHYGHFAYPFFRVLRPDKLLKGPENRFVLLEQDFEDKNIFREELAFKNGGKGDRGTSAGSWRNSRSNGDYYPKAVVGNSTLSMGNRCVRLYRAGSSVEGHLFGVRENLAMRGLFSLEFSFKPVSGSDFSFSAHSLKDYFYSGDKIAVRYTDGKLYVSDSGAWLEIYSSLSQNRWHSLQYVVDIDSGAYDVNLWKNDDWQHLGTAGFNKTEMEYVTGVYAYMHTAGSVYLDDIRVVSLDIQNCNEYQKAGYEFTGDLNHDCIVDFEDLIIMVSNWLNKFQIYMQEG